MTKDQLRHWSQSLSFAQDGNALERRYKYMLSDFPRLEEFWRIFVAPLTPRLTQEKSKDDFRSGVDPALRYICAANYSLYVHLVFAKVILTEWDETSLETIYSRLASAFDVFEALVIRLLCLLNFCREERPRVLAGISEEEFLSLAKNFYREKYPTLFSLYLSVGKKPPSISIPTKTNIFDEYFKGNPYRKRYHKLSSGEIRAFRNVITHDVRLGLLMTPDGSTYIPRSSVVGKYRLWSDIAKVADKPDLFRSDFCEAKAQCSFEISRTIEVLNALYEQILGDFEAEFFSDDRTVLRDLFGISLEAPARRCSFPNPSTREQCSYSASIATPAPISGTRAIPPSEKDEAG